MLMSFLKSGSIFQLRFQHHLGTNRKIDSGRRLVFLSESEEPAIARAGSLSSSDTQRPGPFLLLPLSTPPFLLSASSLPSLLPAHLAFCVSFCPEFFQLTPISPHPITMCLCRCLRGSCMARVVVTAIVAVIFLSKSGEVDYLCPADCGRMEFGPEVLEMFLCLLNYKRILVLMIKVSNWIGF